MEISSVNMWVRQRSQFWGRVHVISCSWVVQNKVFMSECPVFRQNFPLWRYCCFAICSNIQKTSFFLESSPLIVLPLSKGWIVVRCKIVIRSLPARAICILHLWASYLWPFHFCISVVYILLPSYLRIHFRILYSASLNLISENFSSVFCICDPHIILVFSHLHGWNCASLTFQDNSRQRKMPTDSKLKH